MRFKGQTAVVTGGSSGIGKEISLRLLNEGARVVVWDQNPFTLEGEQIDLHFIKADIGCWENIVNALNNTLEISASIDILICSAGIAGPNVKGWEYEVHDWRHVFEINTNGTFYCNKALIPVMQKNNYGRIVNIASIAGKEGNPNASAYSASKAAVVALTKSLGKELATLPITVNCVTPAAVKTAIFDQLSQEHINYMLSKIPMGRFGRTDEIASLVCWVASPECSFTTGAVFDISGGRATY